MQLSVRNSTASAVKLLQSSKAADSSIGALQIRFASVSLMPLDVGQVRFECTDDVGMGIVALGGGAVSLAVITAFPGSGVLKSNHTQSLEHESAKIILLGEIALAKQRFPSIPKFLQFITYDTFLCNAVSLSSVICPFRRP